MTAGIGKGPKGFTLIELLVVIIILAILSSLVALGVNHAIRTSKVEATRTTLLTLSAALDRYRARWGDYPPSSLAAMGVRVPNATNNGIESMIACLASNRRGGSLLAEINDEFYCNTDGDQLTRNPNDWFFGDNKLREVSDMFGFPVVYLHCRDYAKPAKEVASYQIVSGGEKVLYKPLKSGNTGTFVNPMKFQLLSTGPDGVLGSEDDILVR